MDKWRVTLELTEKMLGTVPKNKEVYTNFIQSKAQDRVEPPMVPAAITAQEVDTVVQELEGAGWTGFHQNQNGLLVYDYFIKGFIKNAANILKSDMGKFCLKKAEGGFANFKSHINNYVFVRPREVHIEDDLRTRTFLKAPDGVLERPLRAMTAQGPRVALVKSDYVSAGRFLAFEIWLADGHPFQHVDEMLGRLLAYGELQGLGQWRNGSFGTFRVVRVEVVK